MGLLDLVGSYLWPTLVEWIPALANMAFDEMAGIFGIAFEAGYGAAAWVHGYGPGRLWWDEVDSQPGVFVLGDHYGIRFHDADDESIQFQQVNLAEWKFESGLLWNTTTGDAYLYNAPSESYHLFEVDTPVLEEDVDSADVSDEASVSVDVVEPELEAETTEESDEAPPEEPDEALLAEVGEALPEEPNEALLEEQLRQLLFEAWLTELASVDTSLQQESSEGADGEWLDEAWLEEDVEEESTEVVQDDAPADDGATAAEETGSEDAGSDSFVIGLAVSGTLLPLLGVASHAAWFRYHETQKWKTPESVQESGPTPKRSKKVYGGDTKKVKRTPVSASKKEEKRSRRKAKKRSGSKKATAIKTSSHGRESQV